MKLEDRMLKSIQRRAGNIILRSDVANLGSDSQVSEALHSLQAKKALVRIAVGVYAKTQSLPQTGKAHAHADLRTLTREALPKLYKTVSIKKWSRQEERTEHFWIAYISADDHRIKRKFQLDDQFVLVISAPHNKKLEKPSCDHLPGAKDEAKASARDDILRLAKRHHINYTCSFQDQWAAAVTRLAGDDVVVDPIKDLLIALKRAGKVSATEMTTLLIAYLREKKHVRPV